MDMLGGSTQPDPNAPPVVPGAQQPAPLPASLLGGGPAPMPAAPVAPAPVATPSDTHMARVGRAFKSILGTQVDYQTDPSTGKTVAVPVKASGSQIFRGILAGALLGAEAGQAAHNENPQGGFLAGMAAGGGQAIKQNTAVDAQRRQRAQEDFKNSLEVRKQNNEDIYRDAQIAHMHIEDAHAQMQMDLIPQEHIQTLNASNDILAEKYGSQGNPAQILVGGKDINGKEGNVYDIQKAITDDKGTLKAPDGFHRVSTQHVDTVGLKYKPGVGWLDAEGKNVDMATRTTMTVYDVPNDMNKQSVTLTGKQWNSVAGAPLFPNDDSLHTGSAGSLIAFKDKATKDVLEKAQANRQNEMAAAQAASLNKQTKLLQLQMNKMDDTDLRANITGMKETADLIDKQIKNYRGTIADFNASEADKKTAQAGLNAATEDYNEALSNIKSIETAHLKKQGLDVTTRPTLPPVDPVDTAFNFLSQYPPDQQVAYAQSSTTLTPEQKQSLIGRVQARVRPAQAQQQQRPAAAPAGVPNENIQNLP